MKAFIVWWFGLGNLVCGFAFNSLLSTVHSFALSNHSPFCFIRYESIIATLCENLDSLDEPDARAAMIWIVGEYAERIDNADELLESFLEGFHDESTQVSDLYPVS